MWVVLTLKIIFVVEIIVWLFFPLTNINVPNFKEAQASRRHTLFIERQ